MRGGEKEKNGGAVGERTAPLKQTPQQPQRSEARTKRFVFEFCVSRKLLTK